MSEQIQRFIVAEVSKNWTPERAVSIGNADGHSTISKLFEKILEVNLLRGYLLHSYKFSQVGFGTDALVETIIAVFEHKDYV